MTHINLADDYLNELKVINEDLILKLDVISNFYTENIVDFSSLYHYIHSDSLSDMLNCFQSNVNLNHCFLDELLRNWSKFNKASTADQIISLASIKELKRHSISKERSNDLKEFTINKEKKRYHKTESLKYLYKRIRNSFNAYILFKINCCLKSKLIKSLPRTLKIVKQDNSQPFNNLFKFCLMQLLTEKLSLEMNYLIQTQGMTNLDILLHKPVICLYQEYIVSKQYIKDMKLMESQVGTYHAKLLLDDMTKHMDMSFY